jgi:lambda family phage portal protein
MKLPAIRPTLTDRVVAYFDPVRGAERFRARMVLALAGGYTGGRRDRRATSEWRTTSGSADADLLPDLAVLRDRSRDLTRNAPLAAGAVSTVVTNVVGTGLEPQSQIDRDLLGLTDQAADDWQRAVEREWWLWASSTDCDVTRTQDFCALQDLIFRATLESGDVFIVKRSVERPGNPYGLALQVIEADRVTNPDYRQDGDKLPNGRLVAGGVEVDRNGAPVAYHVLRNHPGDVTLGAVPTWDRLAAFSADSGARLVHHLFRRLRPAQSRGVPYLASVVEPFKQLSRYSDAELMAAVVSSMFTVFVRSEAGEGLSAMQPTDETGSLPADEDYKLGNGAILDLTAGESIEIANPGRPNAGFDPFVQSLCRQIGVALELPYEVFVKHFESSYSAARAALLEVWKFFRARRDWLASNFCQPVYAAVVDEAVASGRLAANGYFADPLIRRAWLEARWIGPPAGQIDPEAEIKAAETRIALGISTGAQTCAEMTGGDIESNIAQLGKEKRLRDEAGLDPVPAAKPAAPPPAPTPRPAGEPTPQRTAARARG